jgi:hypothetical protein
MSITPPNTREVDGLTVAWRGAWPILLALVAVSAAVHAWVIGNTAVTARDSVGFARYALNLENPTVGYPERPSRTRLDVLRDEKHPPVYPTLVLLASWVVRPLTHTPLPEQMLLSAQLASSATALLLVFPSVFLGRALFGRSAGYLAAFLLQLLPVVARDTSDGLTDGPFLLCASAALAAAVWGFRSSRWEGFGWAGGFAGLAYLVRPEGVVAVLAVLAVCGACVVTKRLGLKAAAGRATAVAVGFLAVGGPYMLAIGDFTNKPAMSKTAGFEAEARRFVVGPPFAEAIPTHLAGRDRVKEVASTAGKEWLKATHYGVAIYAVIGVFTAWPLWTRRPEGWLLAVFAAGHLGVVFILGYKAGYISERHLLPVVLVGTLFAVGGLPGWFRLWTYLPVVGPVFRRPVWPYLTVAALAATCLPPLARPLHDNRLGHKLAGRRLAVELHRLNDDDPASTAGVVVIDHYEWAQFFAGRSVYRIPPDPPADRQTVLFAVLELKDGTPEEAGYHSDRHKAAVDLFQDKVNPPEWVATWPPNAGRESARVVLLRQNRR